MKDNIILIGSIIILAIIGYFAFISYNTNYIIECSNPKYVEAYNQSGPNWSLSIGSNECPNEVYTKHKYVFGKLVESGGVKK